MNKQELKEFSAVCQEVKEIKTNYQKIENNLSEINRKLDNHITHIEGNIASIQTNIDWIIKAKDENKGFKEDATQNANISWITKLIFLGIGLAITLVVELFKKYIL
jgi:prefoldin subunit 5